MRTRMFICIGLAICGAATAWHVVLAPARDERAGQRGRLAAVQADLHRATSAAQRLPGVEQEVSRLEAALQRHRAAASEGTDAQAVLRSLHQLASESNLRVNSFTPRPAADHPHHREWPIELGLEGGFDELTMFFERLAGESRLVSVTHLRLKANANAGAARRGLISASCVATTFVFGGTS